MPQENEYPALQQAGQILRIRGGEIRIWTPSCGKEAIGAAEANDALCVVVFGQESIFVGMISSRPSAGAIFDRLSTAQMALALTNYYKTAVAGIVRMLQLHPHRFPPLAPAWILLPWQMIELKDLMRDRLWDLGIDLVQFVYESREAVATDGGLFPLVARFNRMTPSLQMGRFTLL